MRTLSPAAISGFAKRRSHARMQRRCLRRIEQQIDWEGFEALRAQFVTDAVHPEGAVKYFDADRYLRLNIQRAIAIGLHRRRPARILDLGCGFGYFMLVSRFLGHEALGLDYVEPTHPENQVYPCMVRLFGLQRIEHQILRRRALPDLEGPFDWVTAHQICFALHDSEERWDVEDWRYFLADLKGKLKPDGRVHLEFNPHREHRDPSETDPFHSDALKRYLLDLGARVCGPMVRFGSASLLPS